MALIRVAEGGVSLRDLQDVFSSHTKESILEVLEALRRNGAVVQQGAMWRTAKRACARKGRKRPRAVTIAENKPFTVGESEEDLPLEAFGPRPRTREECGDERPCPWVCCKFNLYLDVNPSGSIKLNFPTLEPWDLKESCALDVADRGGVTLEEVGEILNLTRERVRQIEVMGLLSLKNKSIDLEASFKESLEVSGVNE